MIFDISSFIYNIDKLNNIRFVIRLLLGMNDFEKRNVNLMNVFGIQMFLWLDSIYASL